MKRIFLLLMATVLCFAGCSSSQESNTDNIVIANIVTTESQILSYMLKYLIEYYTDEEVELINNLGSSMVLHQAMINGDANISALRYTGTDLTGPLQEAPMKDSVETLAFVQKAFNERFNQTFFDSYGFENTYAFMVSKEMAQKHNLTKISDLQSIASTLQAGVDTSWMNREGDGYKAFTEAYAFDFKRTYPMQIGLVYDAVQAGEVDVVLGYTTDGRIASYDLTVLEDDLNFFPPYDASMMATNELLEAKPHIKPIMSLLVGKISTEKMQELNYLSDNNLMEPAVVAENFLIEHNYFSEEVGDQ
ncbi:osmoprotectant ABC transporter substrate-binding protein [Caryophanon latum]|uniref:Glycine/betaine ABC transporter substrate-binding protein n=1 Tax=Caryophanon latum TaxID=33977 RepID=A0A1C0YUZ3_9BACL|nr:osmoprotectant ABC transporter substrate-binding protein [Caryophanon latum]OCS90973.1 glycine/betaine ABC transporter substrate-binding protein [Caryophanon latum]